MATKKAKAGADAPAFALSGASFPIRAGYELTLGRQYLYNRSLGEIETVNGLIGVIDEFLRDAIEPGQHKAFDAALAQVTDTAQLLGAVSGLFDAVAGRPTRAPASS